MQNLNFRFIFFISIILFFGNDIFAQNYSINRYGRKIQLDGFLLEWSSKTAHPWNSDSQFVWDAINTPEGLAGYLHSRYLPSCSKWTFLITSQNSSAEPLTIKIEKDSMLNRSSMYQVDIQAFVSSGLITVEWLIPWTKISVDNSGLYKLCLNGYSACGDSLHPIVLNGSKQSKKTFVWRGTAIRAGVIAVLSVIFILMRGKIRRQMNQKGSPHRSA